MREQGGEAGLIDVLDRVLDKGIVIDAHVRVSVAGVELVSVQARVVVASIQTYLQHADTLAYTSLAAQPLLRGEEHEPTPPLIAEPVDPLIAPTSADGEPAAPDAIGDLPSPDTVE